MSIFLGKPDYSPIKDYAELQGDMSVVNSSVFVTEGRVIKIDTNYAFCMIAKGVTDISKPEDFKADSPVCFIAHTKDYTRWTKDNPKLPVQPTELEKTLVQWLESDGAPWLEKSFKGKLHLNGASSVLAAITANKLWHILAEFEECEPDLIKVDSLKAGGKRSYGNNGQTEAQRLNDRHAYVINQLGGYGEGVTNLVELTFAIEKMRQDMPVACEDFRLWLNLILSK